VADCVNSLLDSTNRQERVEIIVVDNGSTDSAAARVATLATPDRSVRVITDSQAGATRARNRGLEHARSELVAFIDDDVFVEPGWLDAVRARFVDPAVVGVAGRIALTMEHERPEWLTTDLETWYAALDLGDEDHELAPGQHGWTANFTVRRETALAVGGFNEQFGPGNRTWYNDDIDFSGRMRSAGTIWYAADARVLHRVGRERLTRRWLLRRTYLQGRSNAALVRTIGSSGSAELPFACDGFRDAVSKRWLRTLSSCRDRATRQNVLLRDAMRRTEALGFAWERSRAVLGRGH
jgi:GT2 family glycosyltransferase